MNTTIPEAHDLSWPVDESPTTAPFAVHEEYPDPLSAHDAPAETPLQHEADTYAPVGPHDSAIDVRPPMAGYRGFSNKIWFALAGLAFVILFAFAWKSGLFGASTTTTTSTTLAGEIATPDPQSTAMTNVDAHSDAVPVGSATAPHRVLHGAASAPQGDGTTPQTSSDYQPPSDSAVPPAYQTTLRAAADTARGAQVPDPNSDMNPQQYPTQYAPPATTQIPGAQGQGSVAAGGGVAEQVQAAANAPLVVANTTGSAGDESVGNAGAAGSGANADVPQDGDGPRYSLWAGDVIPAILDTGIVSDISGPVVAHIERSVYDSKTGQHLLIPAGSRIVGSYGGNSVVAQGQTRLGVEWRLLILPTGREVPIGNLPASDLSGSVGLPAQVDNHNGRVFKTTAFLGLLAGLAQLGQAREQTTNITINQPPSIGSTIAGAEAQQFAQTSSQAVQQQGQIPPTLTIKKGTSFTVIVDHTLGFPAYQGTP